MKISTTGYLIIEGNRAEFANLKMQKGTLICNALSVSLGSEFSGGTVITNVLSERAATGNTSEDNADGYPFGRSVSGSTGTFNFTFSGSKVYLFGHYSTTANGSYDSKLDQTATALTDGNPVKPMVEQYRSGGVYMDTGLPCPELLRRSGLRTGSTLYLNRYSVTFTADGFATEYGTSSGNGSYTFDASRSFSYQGNIRLSEEGAETKRSNTFGTTNSTNEAPLTFTKGSATTNMIYFTRDFENLSEGKQQREIVLSNLIQTYTERGAKQTVLENFIVVSGSDGTVNGGKSTVTITIPGEAGTYRVRFSIKRTSEWDDVYCSFIVK